MATVVAVLHHKLAYFHWTGFYLVTEPNVLEIGPYQGPPACSKIPFAKGVCGTCAQRREVIIVEDVHAFPGYISCHATTNSEIVIPVIDKDNLIAVLDVDSDDYSAFDHTDQRYLKQVVHLLLTTPRSSMP